MKHIALIMIVLVSFTSCKKKNLEATTCTTLYSSLQDTVYLNYRNNYFAHVDGLTYVLDTDHWNNGADYFVWDNGDTANSIIVSDSGDYTVTAYSNNYGNSGSLDFHIGIPTENIQVPNSFTPNGDGINNEFKPFVFEICQDSYSFFVYTVKNDLIFQTTYPDIGWDGHHKGSSLPQGYYTYQIQATTIDGEYIEKKGEIYLIR